jgi:hypothetical protein
MAARTYSGSVSTLMPLLVNHPSPPLIPTLSGPSCAPPKHWQISGLDGATATCHSGRDSDIIVSDNLEFQDPERQLDG